MKQQRQDFDMERNENEREWLRKKEALEKESILCSKATENVQEERLALQEKQNALEVEQRNLQALKFKLESDVVSRVQVIKGIDHEWDGF